jgi:hypothetical protein
VRDQPIGRIGSEFLTRSDILLAIVFLVLQAVHSHRFHPISMILFLQQ